MLFWIFWSVSSCFVQMWSLCCCEIVCWQVGQLSMLRSLFLILSAVSFFDVKNAVFSCMDRCFSLRFFIFSFIAVSSCSGEVSCSVILCLARNSLSWRVSSFNRMVSFSSVFCVPMRVSFSRRAFWISCSCFSSSLRDCFSLVSCCWMFWRVSLVWMLDCLSSSSCCCAFLSFVLISCSSSSFDSRIARFCLSSLR